MTNRFDPISYKYYKPLEVAENLSGYIFYILAILSFATLLIDKEQCPIIYQFTVIFFVLFVVIFFLINLTTRYYLFPRAEDERRREFVSSVYGVALTHERTVGYYNNSEQNVDKKLIITLMENTFFSKSILRLMLKAERVRCLVYLVIFLILMLQRTTPLDWVLASTQVIFSEEVLVKWIRMEWLKSRAENIYDNLYRIAQSNLTTKKLQAFGLEWFSKYESGKSLAGIVQSGDLFSKVNPELSHEWETIKQQLQID